MTNYNLFAIRFDDVGYNIGDELPDSRVWDDGIPTEETLHGTCGIYVSDETDFLEYLDGKLEADCGELDKYNKALLSGYSGKHIYLIGILEEWGFEWGEDEGEIILNGAEVVRIIR